jgi:FKBP-type peptidyl-prolyl cis-trans isomerase FkpA
MKQFKTDIMIATLFLVLATGGYYFFNKKNKSYLQLQFRTQQSQLLYYLGSKLGVGLQNENWSPEEAEYIARGFKDSALKQLDEKIISESSDLSLQNFLQERKSQELKKVRSTGKEFYDQFISKGAQVNTMGLAFEVLKQGVGEKPKRTDFVEVIYKNSLIDGKPVLSAGEIGHPARVKVEQLITGLSLAVQMMLPGSKLKLVLPPELAYGVNGLPPLIPGGSYLISEVELVRKVE